MKKVALHLIKTFFLVVIMGALVIGSNTGKVLAVAGVSARLSYQGRLTDNAGTPLSNTYCIRYSIYDAQSGGTKLWPAGIPTATSTMVSNGVFNAPIGEMDSLANYDFSANTPEYLNVEVNTTPVSCGGTWENLSPRQSIDATAYARVAYSVYGGDVQVGTGMGVVSGQKLLKLDVKSVADTVGASGCTPNGALWYNSGNGRTMVCNNNLYQAVGSSIANQFFDVTGPTTAVKTFTFPDASATVLTSNAAVTAAQGGTGQTTYTIGDLLYASASNVLSRLAKGTANQVLSMDGTGTNVTWATPTGGGTPAGATTQIQFNNAGAFSADADFTWDSTNNKLTLGGIDTNIIMKAITNEPAAPAAGNLTLYAKSVGGRMVPKWIGPAGIDNIIQTFVGQSKIAWWNAPGNATTLPGVLGFTAPTALGTATARNVATTNMFTRLKRLGYVSAATAGSLAGHYNVAAGTQNTIGAGGTPALGGFYYVVRFGTSDAATVAGSREFIGMTSNTAAPTNVEPSTLTNSIGVGHGAADTNLMLYYGGSTAQTPINLGANFPIRTLSTDMYELILWAPSNSNTTVGYKVTRLNTGNVAEGTLTAATPGTQLPASTTLLGHRAWTTNNATALAVGIDIVSVYIESDD